MLKRYTVITDPENQFPLTSLMKSIKDFDGQKLPDSRVFMNAHEYADLRKFHRDHLFLESNGDIIRTGHMGSIGDVVIMCNRLVPPGFYYLASGIESKVMRACSVLGPAREHAYGVINDFEELRLADFADHTEAPRREFLFPVTYTKALGNSLDNYFGEVPIPVKFKTDKGLCQLATISGNLEIVGDIGFTRISFDPDNEATRTFIERLESRPDDVYLNLIGWREISRNEGDGTLEAGATSELVNLVFDDEKPGSHGPIYEVTGGEPVRLTPKKGIKTPKQEFLIPVLGLSWKGTVCTQSELDSISAYYAKYLLPVMIRTDKGLQQISTLTGGFEVIDSIGFAKILLDPADENVQPFINSLKDPTRSASLELVGWGEVKIKGNDFDGFAYAEMVFEDTPSAFPVVYETINGERMRLTPEIAATKGGEREFLLPVASLAANPVKYPAPVIFDVNTKSGRVPYQIATFTDADLLDNDFARITLNSNDPYTQVFIALLESCQGSFILTPNLDPASETFNCLILQSERELCEECEGPHSDVPMYEIVNGERVRLTPRLDAPATK